MKLPINLVVVVPAVENAIDGNAYRPSDVIISMSGKTIEVGNTVKRTGEVLSIQVGEELIGRVNVDPSISRVDICDMSAWSQPGLARNTFR